ncbi:ornithine cyclodeaminase [Comamonas testosteroni]
MTSTSNNYTATVDFLSTDAAAELVRRVGLTPLLAGLVTALEEDFARWQDFDKTARLAQHTRDGVMELMPVADADHFAFKYVNGHPKNPQRGIPSIMAFGALMRADTGAPVLLSELTLTTALRTAATSVMAAKRLARANSRTMALIGNGSQSEFQALAFIGLLGIEALRLFDIDRAATDKLVRHLQAHAPQVQVTVCDSAAHAADGADIVTTATADKTNATILTRAMVQPGMHLNAVGGDCPGKTELDAAILPEASVFVEFAPQSRIEGEIQHMAPDFAVTELWQVLHGKAPGRQRDDEITVFDSVGFALEDYSAMRYLHALAQKHGVLQPLLLLPQLANPKDLFGVLHADSPARNPLKTTAATA